MADVQVSSQLQQWSFEKPAITRPDRSSSAASSPDLSHHEPETLRIDAAAVQAAQKMVATERGSFHERYLSSEEDLSPMDGNSSEDYDSDVEIHEVKQCFQARKMSVSKWENGKSCDMAVTVSYVVAGRPKVIDLAALGSPIRDAAQRPASMQQPPITTTDVKRKNARHTMMPSTSTTRSNSPVISVDSRRPSTARSPYSHSNKSALNLSDSASYTGSTRSSSPSVSEKSTSTRPASAAASLHPLPRRSSLYLVSSASRTPTMGPMPPLTPQSPEPHAFLSSDPYESSTVGAASPIIKSGPHKRLRSISQRLSLAKIAITPSTRKWDSRINGKPGNMPLTPASPYSPMTPQTAPPTASTSPLKKLQRNSRMMTRPPTRNGSSSEMPNVTIMPAPPTRRFASERMVARGANEREPPVELPPFPDDATGQSSIKSRKIRKRKSLMDLL
ncbi:hypothetical protein K458DRAFT_442393 [Lentithecium fluviatile CBS 122367]|uniref:Uncharacterized protein n=1 Tax=Lentithecium fluviatile CBS 122367 TaxID=1168545 RepID=A0A6G1J4Y1_9PLEO|nr:hypothetical protein K458DRAFT_442393 [Lentithecium fluviatile CBS 122367]